MWKRFCKWVGYRWKVWEFRRLYKRYCQMCDQMDCGITLRRQISSEYRKLEDRLTKLSDELRAESTGG